MKVVINTEVEVHACHHRAGGCLCGVDYAVTVRGEVFQTADQWDVRITDVSGLPGWLDWSELPHAVLEDLHEALEDAARTHEAYVLALPADLRRCAHDIRAGLTGSEALDNPSQQVGALKSLLQRTSKQLELLARRAA